MYLYIYIYPLQQLRHLHAHCCRPSHRERQGDGSAEQQGVLINDFSDFGIFCGLLYCSLNIALICWPSMGMCIYYIYMHTYIYTYIYIYICCGLDSWCDIFWREWKRTSPDIAVQPSKAEMFSTKIAIFFGYNALT